MGKLLSIFVALVVLVSFFAGCQSKPVLEKYEAEEIIILCPNIFASVIKEIKPAFEESNPSVKVKLKVYPIRPMLDDILHGKTGDIFLTLGDVELASLYEKDIVKKGSEKAFTRTALVALGASGNPLALKALKDLADKKVTKISVPDPRFNSAGSAFIAAAKKTGIYDNIDDKLYLAPGPNSATKYMEQGKANVSITYTRCYYGHAQKNGLIEFIPTNLHEPIVCKAIIFKSSQRTESAEKFIEFLLIPENKDLFKNF